MTDSRRKVVLENMLIAGYPMIPSDLHFASEPIPGGDEETGNASVAFPGIRARLITSIPENGATIRADKLYEVHYHLLSLAAMSDYEDRTVYYTSRGLALEMGWGEGGAQLQRVRDCVDYLWRTSMEFEGDLPDALIRHYQSAQTRSYRILISRGFPKEEERKSGGRNLSFIEYHPRYLLSIRNDPGVQLDVELLTQIPGALGKAFYRTASWLKAIGEDRIDLAELFERAGSTRSDISKTYAKRFFKPAWDMMRRYRYLRSDPRIERQGIGKWVVHFDWGDPVLLPHRADALYRAITDAGVHTRVAEEMITTDRERIRRIMQAHRAGALPRAQKTLAAQIVHYFQNDKWEFEDTPPKGEQMDLLSSSDPQRVLVQRRSIADIASAEPTPVDWSLLLDWAELSAGNGDWSRCQRDVLMPLLSAAGEENPEMVFFIAPLRDRLQRAFEQLGWRATLQTLYEAAPYLSTASRPASYIARVLENTAGPGVTPPMIPAVPPPAPVRAQPAAPENRSPSDLQRASFNLSILERAHIESWLEDLERTPNRDSARRALQFVEERRARPAGEEVLALLDQIHAKAEALVEQ